MEDNKLSLSFLLNPFEGGTLASPVDTPVNTTSTRKRKRKQSKDQKEKDDQKKRKQYTVKNDKYKDKDTNSLCTEAGLPDINFGSFRDEFLREHTAELRALILRAHENSSQPSSPTHYPDAQYPSRYKSFNPDKEEQDSQHSASPPHRTGIPRPLAETTHPTSDHNNTNTAFLLFTAYTTPLSSTTLADTTPEATTREGEDTNPMRRWIEEPEGIEITKTKKPWKGRKKPNKQQREYLERFFWHNPYPDNVTRENIASCLGMESKTISTWFQNKRSRHKKSKSQRQVLFHSVTDEGQRGRKKKQNGKVQ